MPADRQLILYIATSLDGYIAQPNDDLGFLSVVEKAGEDYGYSAFTATVDTIIMGRKTYDWVTARTEFPHLDKTAYIITRMPRASIGNTHFYTGSLPDLVQVLKAQPGKHIFCDGGAEVANALLMHQLIDELIISVVPVLVGSGIKLFQDGRPVQPFTLVSTKTFDTGLVQLHYRRAESH